MNRILAAAFLLSCGAARAELTRIGVAGGVLGSVHAAAPGEPVGRVLQSGKPVFLNDHVKTDSKSRLQVILLDETVFTIGPDSDMVLDEFVYDPKTSAGKVSARVAKGVFRFVTGKVARKDPEKMSIAMPVGTMGIRGTIGGGEASPERSVVVLLGPGAANDAGENVGAVIVSNGGSDVRIDRPGFGTTILPNQPPAVPSDMRAFIGQMTGALQTGTPNLKPAAQTASGGPAADQSGQKTASGGGTAQTSFDLAAVQSDLGTTSTQATQDAASDLLKDGPSTWDQLRTLQQGTGYYSGSGNYFCSGGSCGSGETGTASMSVYVDFTNRTYGGTSSNLNVNGTTLNDSASIPLTSYSSLAGNAAITLSQSAGNLNATTNGGSFDGSTVVFGNVGGTIAQKATFNLNYKDAAGTATATATMSGTQGTLPPQ